MYSITIRNTKYPVSALTFWSICIPIMCVNVALFWWAIAGWSQLIHWSVAIMFLLPSCTAKVNGVEHALIHNRRMRDTWSFLYLFIGIVEYWYPWTWLLEDLI